MLEQFTLPVRSNQKEPLDIRLRLDENGAGPRISITSSVLQFENLGRMLNSTPRVTRISQRTPIGSWLLWTLQ